MSPTTTGPCGLPLSALLGHADRFARTMASFGLTDRDVLMNFCLFLGERLTGEYLGQEGEYDLRPYPQRLDDLVRTAVGSLDRAGLWQACADLGPYDGPALDAQRLREAAEMALLGFDTIRHHLGASPAEILDLLAWKQTVLGVSLLFEREPDLADRLGRTRPDRLARSLACRSSRSTPHA